MLGSRILSDAVYCSIFWRVVPGVRAFESPSSSRIRSESDVTATPLLSYSAYNVQHSYTRDVQYTTDAFIHFIHPYLASYAIYFTVSLATSSLQTALGVHSPSSIIVTSYAHCYIHAASFYAPAWLNFTVPPFRTFSANRESFYLFKVHQLRCISAGLIPSLLSKPI